MKSHETDLDEDLKNIVGAQLIKLFKEAAVDQNEAFEESSTVSITGQLSEMHRNFKQLF